MRHPETGRIPSHFGKPSRLVLLAAFMMVAGCDRAPETVVTDNASAATSTSEETNAESTKPISNERALKFAKELGEAIATGNSRATARLIAWPEIVARAAEPFDINETDKSDLIRDAVRTAERLTNGIAIAVKKGSLYQLLHVKQQDGDPIAMFRLLSRNGTLNYHRLRIRRIRGQIRADQFVNAAQGGDMSEAIRITLAKSAKNFMPAGKTTEQQKRLIEDLEFQQRITEAAAFGFEEEALKLYDQLPDRLKMNRIMMLSRTKAIPDDNQSAKTTAVKECLANFPEDPAGAMMALDVGAINADIDLLLKSHQILNQWTGGDLYLDLLVGASLAGFGSHDLALKMTESIDPSSAGVSSANTFKLSISLAVGDHAEVLKQLRILRDEFKVEFSDLRESEKFRSFVASPEYEQWKND
ncbi:hypothetical protein N9L06_03370 [Mariniblastus sp.]|nr:hypothetical protein [Mariniblastus sp.]